MKIDSARFVRSAVKASDFPRDGRPEVTFVGRSNVGKSTLLNTLLGRKALARVSSTPGRTRAVNLFLINDRVWFVDLPGYGWARAGKQERQQWAELVESYLRLALPEAHVIQLVDSKVGATVLDEQGYEYLRSLGAEPTIVATKIDRVPSSRRRGSMREIRQALGIDRDTSIIPFSARTREGVKELWSAVDARLRDSAK